MDLRRLDLGTARTDYVPAWERQRALHAEVADGVRRDTILLLEHESVYTAGKRTARSDRPVDGTPVVDVDRGGRITWHGPGQLVAYPILALREPVDVLAYVRALEDAVMAACAALGVPTTRIEGRTGVWVAGGPDDVDRKICAIGVRVARATTMHGIALNVGTDLSAYDRIVPCGIADAGVTSLSAELGRTLTLTEVADVLEPILVERLTPLTRAAATPVPFVGQDLGLTAVGGTGGGCCGGGDCGCGHGAATRAPAIGSHIPAALLLAEDHKVATAPAPAGTSSAVALTGAATTGSAAPAAPAPERKMLRVEARNAQTPIGAKPEWIKTRATMGPAYNELKDMVHSKGLHTVCEEAGCPNIYECWEDREATFLIGGAQCTRRCDFCQIDTGKPAAYDRGEPVKVASSVRRMGLKYATVTGVARDDLDDGGAWLYAETVRQIHKLNPGTGVELLIPDFDAVPEHLAEVFSARPEVLAHNVETVPRIFRRIRPGFRYDRSLSVLTAAREDGFVTKSNLMLGMGETFDEVVEALGIIRSAGCDLITINQYMRPSVRHHPVDRWVKPQEFVELSEVAEELGYLGVMAGPLVRSSYRAGRLWGQAMVRRGETVPEPLKHLTEEGTARQEASFLLAGAR